MITRASLLFAHQHRHRDRGARLRCWRRIRGGGIDPDGGLPGLPHFPPKAKRVIFLHQSGGPSQMDLFDYKPKLEKLAGSELPDSVRMGQRITGMTSGQSSFPVARSIFKFEQHGQSRRVGQRAAAAHGEDRGRHRHRQDDEHRRDQSRSGDHVHPDRQPAAGPAQHGRVGQLRAGQREPESAGVRGDDLAGAGAESRSAAVLAPVGQRLSALAITRACASARAAIRCSICTTRRASTPTPGATCWTPRAS